MNETYNVGDYGIFNDAISTTNKLCTEIDNANTIGNDVKTKLSDTSVFMGPCAESIISGINQLATSLNTSNDDLKKINSYLVEVANAYKAGDTKAEKIICKISTGTISNNSTGKILDIATGELGNGEFNSSHHKYEVDNGAMRLGDEQPWCAAFVSWCANQAGYDTTNFPRFINCNKGLQQFKEAGATIHYEADGNYTPQPGDIIFFSWSGTSSLDHVGIVKSADENHVYTIEGNTSDKVMDRTRDRNSTIYAYVTPNVA